MSEHEPKANEEKKPKREPEDSTAFQAQEPEPVKIPPESLRATDRTKKPQTSADWEKQLINNLAFAALNEQRKARRWGIFFKALFAIYFLIFILALLPGTPTGPVPIGKHTALVEIEGVVAAEATASADNIVSGLRAAFEDKASKGIILRANSPGGSPVQAKYVYDEIVRLRSLYPKKPIYAVVTDLCASACYYMIAATEKIYADQASIVGSIGVLSDGFGFVDLMNKLGVERRLLTAGKHKGMLDPFSPLDQESSDHFQSVLEDVHQQFIDAVKQGRGDRLKSNPDIFSGLFWVGAKGKELGLVDDLASAGTVAREIIGEEKIVDFTPKDDFFQRLIEDLGASMANTLFSNIYQTPKLH